MQFSFFLAGGGTGWSLEASSFHLSRREGFSWVSDPRAPFQLSAPWVRGALGLVSSPKEGSYSREWCGLRDVTARAGYSLGGGLGWLQSAPPAAAGPSVGSRPGTASPPDGRRLVKKEEERVRERGISSARVPLPASHFKPICRERRRGPAFPESLLHECQALQGVEALLAALPLQLDVGLLQRQQQQRHLRHPDGAALPVLLLHGGAHRPGGPHPLPDPALPHHLPRPQEEDEEAEDAEGSGGVRARPLQQCQQC